MNKFKKAHSMAKTIKKLYPDVDYKFQFTLCLKLLYGKPLPEGKKEEVKKMQETTTFEMYNGKITPKALIQELNKITMSGVNLKFEWYSKRMTQRVYVKAFIKGKKYEMGYIDHFSMEYKQTYRLDEPNEIFMIDSLIDRKLSEICSKMPWVRMFA